MIEPEWGSHAFLRKEMNTTSAATPAEIPIAIATVLPASSSGLPDPKECRIYKIITRVVEYDINSKENRTSARLYIVAELKLHEILGFLETSYL